MEQIIYSRGYIDRSRYAMTFAVSPHWILKSLKHTYVIRSGSVPNQVFLSCLYEFLCKLNI